MNFYMPTKIYQEENAVKKHGTEIASYGKKALVVTGRYSSRANGSLQDVTEVLDEQNTEYLIYDRIGENPTIAMVMEAAELGRTQGADFVIGVGGGSPMDAAKAIALMIQNRDSSEEVLYQPLNLRTLPVVEVSTTCGTGSEATPYAILTRDDIQTKQSISHRIFPKLALADPRYLNSAPQSVLVHTAIDALGHLIESYFNTKATDYSRMVSRYGMEVWSASRMVLLGSEPESADFENLMFASTLAGMAISHTGTSLPHGLSYYLTYHLGIPHGRAVGLFLPGYLDYCSGEMEIEVFLILRSMGFGSMEQFSGFITECLGRQELTKEQEEEMLDEIMASEGKLAAVPGAVTREEIQNMICRR